MAAKVEARRGLFKGRGQRFSLTIQGLTIGGFLLLWETISRTGLLLKDLFPSVLAVFREVWLQVSTGTLTPHVVITAQEVALGFSFGAAAGVGVGLVVGSNRFLRQVFEPLILYLAVVPKIIIYPIFLWFFGVGLNSKVAVGSSSAFFPVAIMTIAAVLQVSPTYVRAARSMGARPLQIYTKVYLPAMMGHLFAGLRLGMAVAIVGTLLAEAKLARGGLGFLVTEYYANFQVEKMYAVILVMFAFAALINWMMTIVASRLTRFRGSSPGAGFYL